MFGIDYDLKTYWLLVCRSVPGAPNFIISKILILINNQIIKFHTNLK